MKPRLRKIRTGPYGQWQCHHPHKAWLGSGNTMLTAYISYCDLNGLKEERDEVTKWLLDR